MNKFLALVVIVLLSSLTTTSIAHDAAEKVADEVFVKVKFKNVAHAEHFMTWMSEQGEQDMYIWMEEAEPELAKMPSYHNEDFEIDYSNP